MVVQHKCNTCLKIFRQKCHLNDHLKRKFPCKTNIVTIDATPNPPNLADLSAKHPPNPAVDVSKKDKYQCQQCGKAFRRGDYLKKHIDKQRCPKKDNVILQLVDALQLQNERQQEQINALMEQLKQAMTTLQLSAASSITLDNSIKNNTIDNSNHTINNTINIVAYGNESVYDLNKDELKAIIDAEADAIPKCVEMIHFNPRLPFNHNILVTNLRANQMQVKQETGWKSVSADELLDDLVRCKATNVRTIITKRMVDDVHATTAKMLLHQVHTVKNGDDDDKSVKKVKNDLKHKAKLTCYSNRNTVQNLIKDVGHDG